MNILIDWNSSFLKSLEFIGTCLWCILIIDCTLKQKENKSKKIKKWLSIIIIGVFLSFIIETIMQSFDVYIQNMQDWQTQSFMNILLSLFYIVYNAIVLLLPIFIIYLGCLSIYQKTHSIKTFISVLTGLFIIIINEIICGFMMLPFLGNINETGLKSKPYPWIMMIIYILCYILSYLLYKKKICHFLKETIDTPDGRIDRFVKVPIISVIVFTILLSILQTFSISYLSGNWMDVLIYISSSGGLVLVYIMMYWAIFKGITLSSQAIRNQAELDVAKSIQISTLPNTFPAFPQRHEFDIYATMTTAKEVGGDFYDFFLRDENHLSFVIADVSGKGIPAALFMMRAKTLLKNLTLMNLTIEDIMNQANQSLCENNDTHMFVTAWIGILELTTGQLEFVNAGHNPPLYKSLFDDSYYLDQSHHNLMLGIMESISYQKNTLYLKPYDILYLYTDGVSEACNSSQELFNTERLKSCLDHVTSNHPKDIIDNVDNHLNQFVKEAEQFDDITMLTLLYQAQTMIIDPLTISQISNISQTIEKELQHNHYSQKNLYHILIAIDEIVSNIVHYSQANQLIIHYLIHQTETIITFEDNGQPYDPLKNKTPTLHTPIENREIGGLGIYLVKSMMDQIHYTYFNGKNILMIQKKKEEKL